MTTSAPTVKKTLTTCGAIGMLALTAACGSSDDPNTTTSSSDESPGGSIVVGSADFSESILLANIYAGALNAASIEATTHTGIGSREVYLKALEDGSIQIIPEYTGALALYYDKNFSETDPAAVYAALASVLPTNLRALEKSAAEDNDSMAVTKKTADAKNLKTIEDLADVAGTMTLGAPPEFRTRAQGIPGLEKVYGITFQTFRPLKGVQLVNALKNDQVQVANIFSTDPSFATEGFVALTDTKKLFGSQNVVPLVTSSVADKVAPVLNKVSAALTTDALAAMLKETDIDHKDPAVVAKEFLNANSLG
ncbi:MAG: ABC transporter substrate-binding protein [Nostocoides sp.]